MAHSNDIIDDYGMLHAIETNIAISRSNISEVNAALRETEKHLQAAQISLRTALTFKPEEK